MQFDSISSIEDNYSIELGYFDSTYEKIILDLFNADDDFIDYSKFAMDDNNILCLFGIYWHNVKNNINRMKYMYSKAIKNNCALAMHLLATYYNFNEPNEKLMLKYYNRAIQLNFVDSMLLLASYHSEKKNYVQMKQLYWKAIKFNCVGAINNLACHYYFIENDFPMMKKYCLMGIKLGSVNLMNYLARNYMIINQYSEGIKYYLMAYDLSNGSASFELGKHYYLVENNLEKADKYLSDAVKFDIEYAGPVGKFYMGIQNYERMKKFLSIGIENECSFSMKYMGIYYFDVEKNYSLAEKYLLMSLSFDKFVSDTMYYLGRCYQRLENESLQNKYLIMAIELGCLKSLKTLSTYYTDEKFHMEFYKLLCGIKNPNSKIIEQMNVLEKNIQIMRFGNLIRLFKRLNNYHSCALCLSENVLNIGMNCGHDVCVNCWTPEIKCYYNFCRLQ